MIAIKVYLKLAAIGIFTGTIFGLIMKLIEFWTEKKVYTLLLNIDYIPILQDWNLNEFLEFSLHLIVSIGVVFVLYYGFKLFKWHLKISSYIIANIIIASGLYLTTSFSDRTPELTDGVAFIYWVIGHAIYGALLGLTLRQFRESNQSK